MSPWSNIRRTIIIAESNRATRGIKPFVPRDGASEELASATPQGEKRKLDSVEEGQIVHVQTKVSHYRASRHC